MSCGVSVCQFVTCLHMLYKTAERIEVLFKVETISSPKNNVISLREGGVGG